MNPDYPDHAYIGYTVNLSRRIRQHNGQIANGAHRTSKKKPWRVVCFVGGFANHVAGLQFEWNWTYPTDSVILRDQVSGKPFGRHNLVRYSLSVLNVMLASPPWSLQPLTLHWVTPDPYRAVTPVTPAQQIPVTCGPLDKCIFLRDATEAELLSPTAEPHACMVCSGDFTTHDIIGCPLCTMTAHPECLAAWILRQEPDGLIPTTFTCIACRQEVSWPDCIRRSYRVIGGAGRVEVDSD